MPVLDHFATEPIAQSCLPARNTPEWFALQEQMVKQIEEELLLEEEDEDRYYAESSAYGGWQSLD